jgi:hypothetical protein
MRDQAGLSAAAAPDSRRCYVVNTHDAEYLSRQCLMKQAFELWLHNVTMREVELSKVGKPGFIDQP